MTRAAWGLPVALGAHRRRLRPLVAGSPHFSDGKFHNTLETPALAPANTRDGLLRQWHEERHVGCPGGPIPLARTELPAEAAELAVTWFGHASALLEVDGARVLVDPVWGHRVSPSPVFGPTRLHEPPMPLEELPPVDAVLISHDHYDHLDLPTVRVLLETQKAPFVVPLGIGEHLRKWNVPDDRIVELDWDAEHTVGGLTLTCTEARHFSGRYFYRDTTLWASWAIAAPGTACSSAATPATTRPSPGSGRGWALRPDPAAGRRLQRRVALHPHGPRRGGARARRPRRPGAPADPLGHVQPGVPPLGRAGGADAHRRRAAKGVEVAVPRPGERIDVLDPPPVTDWWTEVGSASPDADGIHTQGPGSALLVRAATRLLRSATDGPPRRS